MKGSLNLLTSDNFSRTSLGKFSQWTLTIGRWIVIVTELIVILAFLTRFKLDRDNANLTEDINHKAAVINAYVEFEKEFRTTQINLNTLNNALKQQQNYDQILTLINQSIPNDVVLSQINIKENTLTIKAMALTEPGMAGMQTQLQTSPLFSSVNLIKVDINQGFENGIQFEIYAVLNKSVTSD